jgi:4-amino-4-deoxy-L-arabinose transferase-like glycosyltransferase
LSFDESLFERSARGPSGRAERVKVPAPLRPPGAIMLSDAILFALILAIAATARFWALGADPPLSLTTSNAEVMDGPWYLASAADTVRGAPVDVPAHYRKPLFSALAWTAFRAGGVSLGAAHALAAACGVLLVLAGAAAAWRAYGTRTALVAALFLATSFPLVGYGRAPVVYGPMAALLACVFLLFVFGIRNLAACAAAPLLLAGIALGLKETAIFAAPALVLGLVAASPRPGRALALATAVTVAAGAALFLVRPEAVQALAGQARGYLDLHDPKTHEDLGGAGAALLLVKRVLAAPAESHIAARAFPLLAIAWVGVLFAVARTAQREGESAVARREERAVDLYLVAWLVGTIALSGLFRFDPQEGRSPPLRHFAPALVPAALLAARTLTRLAAGFEPAAGRAGIALWAFVGAYVAIASGWRAFFDANEDLVMTDVLRALTKFTGIAAGAALVAALAAALLGRTFRSGAGVRVRIGGVLVGALVLLVVASDATQLVPALAAPGFTLRDANRASAELLGPGASVDGPWAHALTYDAPLVSRHYIEMLDTRTQRALLEPKARGFTHLAVDVSIGAVLERFYVEAGAPLEPLARFEVRGYPVALYRYSWARAAGYRLSPAEVRLALARLGGGGK